MKFNVMIQNVLPIQSGTSKSGKAWSKQSFVGVYDSSNPQYPKSIVFDVLGDKIGQLNLQQGGQYEVEVDFTAKEWQGRWFLSATCWKAAPLQPQSYGQPMQGAYPPQGAGAFYGQQPQMPVNPNSATPTLDAMGVAGYQHTPQTPPAQNGDDDLPF